MKSWKNLTNFVLIQENWIFFQILIEDFFHIFFPTFLIFFWEIKIFYVIKIPPTRSPTFFAFSNKSSLYFSSLSLSSSLHLPPKESQLLMKNLWTRLVTENVDLCWSN